MRKVFRRTLVAVVLILVLCPCLFASKKPLPPAELVWKPTTKLRDLGVLPSDISAAKIAIKPLADQRPRPDAIGENREDEKNILPVGTTSNVAEFVSNHLGQTLQDFGFNVVSTGADVVLSGELLQYFVTEDNTYNGEVRLRMTLTSKRGKVLWSGSVRGTNKRWGRSYKLENYNEVLTDSLMEAAYNLVVADGFHEAFGQVGK